MSNDLMIESNSSAAQSLVELSKTILCELNHKDKRIKDLEKENRMLLEKIKLLEGKQEHMYHETHASTFLKSLTENTNLTKEKPVRKMLSSGDHPSVVIKPYSVDDLEKNCTKIINNGNIIYFYLRSNPSIKQDINLRIYAKMEIVYWESGDHIKEMCAKWNKTSRKSDVFIVSSDYLETQIHSHLKSGGKFLVLKGSKELRQYLKERLSE